MEDFGSYKLCRSGETASGGAIQKTLCPKGYAPFASTGINSYINFYAPMKSFINMGGAIKAAGTRHYPSPAIYSAKSFKRAAEAAINILL